MQQGFLKVTQSSPSLIVLIKTLPPKNRMHLPMNSPRNKSPLISMTSLSFQPQKIWWKKWLDCLHCLICHKSTFLVCQQMWLNNWFLTVIHGKANNPAAFYILKIKCREIRCIWWWRKHNIRKAQLKGFIVQTTISFSRCGWMQFFSPSTNTVNNGSCS